MKTFKAFILFFKYLGSANWYHGIDKPTLWQRIYKWRIGPSTAWALVKLIILNTKS